jgi:hypothetical protein
LYLARDLFVLAFEGNLERDFGCSGDIRIADSDLLTVLPIVLLGGLNRGIVTRVHVWFLRLTRLSGIFLAPGPHLRGCVKSLQPAALHAVIKSPQLLSSSVVDATNHGGVSFGCRPAKQPDNHI